MQQGCSASCAPTERATPRDTELAARAPRAVTPPLSRAHVAGSDIPERMWSRDEGEPEVSPSRPSRPFVMRVLRERTRRARPACGTAFGKSPPFPKGPPGEAGKGREPLCRWLMRGAGHSEHGERAAT